MSCSVSLQLLFLVIEFGVAFAAPFFYWLHGAERIWPPSGARAERGQLSEEKRSGAKWRGRGLGQRDID